MRSGSHTALLQFLGSLVDFFPGNGDGGCIQQVTFRLHPAAKDLIESMGVPHVEVFALQVNGQFHWLEYNVQEGDELVIYPKKEAGSIAGAQLIKNPEKLPGRFVADVHLGKLARLLRLLGMDTAYASNMDDPEIIEKALMEDRAVLTRDLGLLKHGNLQHGYWLRSTDPEQQVKEVLDYFELKTNLQPFTRCMNCNGLLEPANKEAILDQIPPNVTQWCDEYRQCTDCDKIYWKGSHYEKLVKKINRMLD